VIRSLYLKIFLWFCFVAFVVGTTIFVVTVAMHSQSLGPRWMTGVLDLFARSAVDFYRDNGKAGLVSPFSPFLSAGQNPRVIGRQPRQFELG
jgi:hypothetical protein